MAVTNMIPYYFIRFWTIVFVLLSTGYMAQENKCDSIADAIETEARQGHYLTMDSLFNRFKASSRCREDVYNYKRVLGAVMEQRLADGYRIDEANVLKRKLDSLYKTTPGNETYREDTSYYHPLRIGVLGSASGSNFGYGVTLGYGLTVGWHKERANSAGRKGGWGWDATFSYQRLPFTIDEINNKTNNSYSVDGFILKTRGIHYFYGLSGVVAWDIPRDESWDLSAGLVGGLEFQKQRSTYIKSYYYEYNYRDSIAAQGNLHYLNFNADEKSDLSTSTFFKDNLLMKFILGFNVYWKVTDRCLITFFPYGSLSLTKMKLNEERFSKHVNSAGLKVSVSILSGRRELQRRPRERQKIYK
jgi:hypothetical protein